MFLLSFISLNISAATQQKSVNLGLTAAIERGGHKGAKGFWGLLKCPFTDSLKNMTHSFSSLQTRTQLHPPPCLHHPRLLSKDRQKVLAGHSFFTH